MRLLGVPFDFYGPLLVFFHRAFVGMPGASTQLSQLLRMGPDTQLTGGGALPTDQLLVAGGL